MGEFCYNTNVHRSSGKPPFEIVYGRLPPNLLDYIPRATSVEATEKELMEKDNVMKILRERLINFHARIKRVYDKERIDKEFHVGDMVFLRLQPYQQPSVSMRRTHKLTPLYYGPFRVLERIGSLAHKLKLPKG